MRNTEKKDYDFVGISVKKKVYSKILQKKLEAVKEGKIKSYSQIIDEAIDEGEKC